MLKPRIENILPESERSFSAYRQTGPVIECEYHVHPEYELTLVQSSFGNRLINDDAGWFESGTLSLIGPLVPHHYFNSQADSRGPEWAKLLIVQFREDFAGRTWLSLPEMQPVRSMLKEAMYGLDFTADAETRRLMEKLADETGPRRIGMLLELLGMLSELPRRRISRRLLPELPRGDARIGRTLQLIHSRIAKGKSLTLQEAAANAGLCPEGFCRYFSKVTGHTFVSYMNELKLAKAANLLLHSDDQISAICYFAGFANLSNFNRQFKKSRGMTPREFRKRFASISGGGA